jgi:hypothetical protein
VKMFILSVSVVFDATFAFAETSDPWPAIYEASEANGCVISENDLSDVLKSNGYDIWTINIFIQNFHNGTTHVYDRDTSSFLISKIGNCQ